MSSAEIATVRVCPNCGFSHLRSSRAHSPLEQVQAWVSRTKWFRCQTCKWRGRLRDVWDPDTAFPDLPPLRIARELNIEFLQQRDEASLIDLVLTKKDELRDQLRIWLDDSRPAPPGWLRVTTVQSAQKLLEAGLVLEISLDYDLGWCAECLEKGDHLKRSGARHCPHMLTGYDLVAWMADTRHWSKHPPIVHSGNMDGGAKMLGVIARQWREPSPGKMPEPPRRPASSQVTGHVPEAGTFTALSTCPSCGGARLYRTHRRSAFERMRSMLTRRYPVRCEACGWTRWSKNPILVRVTPGADVPAERVDFANLEQIDDD
jgi:predicted RNA-binding Zn-ribbon protein involved in translation (DUF1610 family)